MILLDTALKARAETGPPVRVGVIGSGFMVVGVALQIRLQHPAIEIVAIAARRPEVAERIFKETLDREAVDRAETATDISKTVSRGGVAVCEDPAALAAADGVDIVLEGTGSMDFALRGVLAAIEAGKHVILMNAELDATVGPLLKAKADAAGVIITNIDGDQPGVEMNLVRYVETAGFRPMLCGSVKTLQDQHRNPETQKSFAERWKQKAEMVTSFADGTKVAFEQAVVANAAGMRVAKRGMIGIDPTGKDPTLPLRPLGDYLDMLTPHLDLDQPGLVDFVVGANPSPGVFVIGYSDHPDQRHYMGYYKMGPGPFYLFYTPYHLVHLEAPLTIARVALFTDATVAPAGPPRVGVVATAKRDLQAGGTLDGIGGFDTYGEAENAPVIGRERLLPMGLAEGARLIRPVAKDQTLTLDDVALPEGRLIDRVYAEQTDHFDLQATETDA